MSRFSTINFRPRWRLAIDALWVFARCATFARAARDRPRRRYTTCPCAIKGLLAFFESVQNDVILRFYDYVSSKIEVPIVLASLSVRWAARMERFEMTLKQYKLQACGNVREEAKLYM